MSLLRQSIKYNLSRKIYQYSIDPYRNSYSQHRSWRLYCSSGAISHPTPDNFEKVYSPKIQSIVEDIKNLTLIEVSDLNECLKKTLKIKDAPMMMGVAPAAAPVAAAQEEDSEPEVTKSSFTVKLTGFDAAKKVAVIKEVKNFIEGMNLVQAKKFVESAPQILKTDIGKDEAENLKKALEAVGGTCEVS
ncbi:39S ribosomal protein L12, mitochondrial [Trichonephila clavata]|uniref:Large ribosomal subunit protein bL12m n=1 Tax=Trichonephila clavata TaxID=2740835 RepID=A0A8X6F8N1_TRICU|nr:39S ribosomal protein L12, mitochondrial [Trichonephila clavata]